MDQPTASSPPGGPNPPPPTAETEQAARLQLRKQQDECEKLEAEAAHQQLANRFWWSKWVIAGVVAGLSWMGIMHAYTQQYFNLLQTNNTQLKNQNEALAKSAVEQTALQADAGKMLQKTQEEKAQAEKLLIEAKRGEALALQQKKASEETRDELQRKMTEAGRGGSEAAVQLAQTTRELQQAKDRYGQLTLELKSANERLKNQDNAACSTSVGAITGSVPHAGETGTDLVRRVMVQYSPFNDLSATSDTTRERAVMTGLPPEDALGSIGLSASSAIVFTRDAIRFRQQGGTAAIRYVDLPGLQLTLDDRNKTLRVGPAYSFDFSRSNFDNAHAYLLLSQLTQIVRACDAQFAKG